MIYVNKEDLESEIQERLLNESIALAIDTELNDNEIVNDIENKAIALVISYIAGKYDYDKIFAETPIRNEVLVQIISRIVVYRCVRRNAARKVPEDYVTLYNDSIAMLGKIQSGAQALVNCPPIIKTNPSGQPVSPISGNNRKSDYFI